MGTPSKPEKGVTALCERPNEALYLTPRFARRK
jgi:hypothetical protein